MDDDETLLFKPEVFLYKMPPSIQKKEGYIHRAADWDIAQPSWYGKLTIFAAGPTCHVMLEDKRGKVFGQAVIEDYPGKVLDNVFDSTRYFVLKIQKKSGEFEKVGIGFSQRKDSAELKSVLTNYFSSIARVVKRPPPDEVPEEAKSPKKLKVAEVKPEPQQVVARKSVQFAASVKTEPVVKVERVSEERESSAGTSALAPKTAPVSAVSPQQRPSNTVPMVPASKLAAGKIVPKVPPPPPTISKPPVKYSASASKEGVADFQPVVVKQERLSIVSPAVENPAPAAKALTAVKSAVATQSKGPLLNVPATVKPKPTAVPVAPKITAVPSAPKITAGPSGPKITASSAAPKITAAPITPKISTSPQKSGPTDKKSSVASIPSVSTSSKTATIAPISTTKQTQPKSILKKSAGPILAAPTVTIPPTVPTTAAAQLQKSLVPYNEKPSLVPYDESFVESSPSDEPKSVDVSEESKSSTSELESAALDTTKVDTTSTSETSSNNDVIMSESSEAAAGNDDCMETSDVPSSEKPTEGLSQSNKNENVVLTSTPEDTASKTAEENVDSADGSSVILASEVNKKVDVVEREPEFIRRDVGSSKGENEEINNADDKVTPEISGDQQVGNESERAIKTEQSSLEFTEAEDGMEGGGGNSLMDTEEAADQIPPPDSVLQEDIPSVLEAEAEKALKEITQATEFEQTEDQGAEEDSNEAEEGANDAEEVANEAKEGANEEDFAEQEEQAADEMEYAEGQEEGAVDESEYAEGQGEEAFDEAEGQEEGAYDEAEGQEDGAFDEAEGQEEEAYDEAEYTEGQEEEAYDEAEYTEGQEEQAECYEGEEYATVEEYDDETGDIIGSIDGEIDEYSVGISNELEDTVENEECTAVSEANESEVTEIEATIVEPEVENDEQAEADSPSSAAPADDANTDTQDDGLQDGAEDEDNITLDQITTAMSGYKYRNGSKFQCHKCPEACEDSQGIKTHWMHAHSYRNPLSCPVCKLPFPSKVEAAMHKKRAHGLFCADCSKVFKNDKEMQSHMRTKHAKDSQLSCKFCGSKFKGKRELVVHYDKDHWSADFLEQCGICKEKFLNDDDLKEHEMTAHVGQNSYACEQCPQTFRTRGALRTHQRQLHPGC